MGISGEESSESLGYFLMEHVKRPPGHGCVKYLRCPISDVGKP